MIIDWDVHHGNGTQEVFWNDKRVLFVSLHQFPFYPGTGAFEEIGGPGAVGMTVNIPMAGGFGDDEWVAAFRRVLAPLGDQFAPQLVLLSARAACREGSTRRYTRPSGLPRWRTSAGDPTLSCGGSWLHCSGADMTSPRAGSER